jgi:2-polyprenyl-6-methoxyphenol hydroxylase-like FAD-dependent oxidoreductase
VIGADGLHSTVAEAVDAPSYDTKPSLTCMYYSYWSGVPMDEALMCSRPGRMVIAFPTNDHLTLVVILWPRAEFHSVRSDIEGQFLLAAETCTPALAERLRAGRREERFVGTASVPNFFRRPYGPGWALVGDAGYHKDPIGAHGIMDAFHDAERLAEAIDTGLAGSGPIDEALAAYENERNAEAAALYEFNAQLATLRPPAPEMQRLFAALAGDRTETDRFFGAFFGTIPMAEFLAPENLERILSRAAPADAVA